jgi:hypothetical protein
MTTSGKVHRTTRSSRSERFPRKQCARYDFMSADIFWAIDLDLRRDFASSYPQKPSMDVTDGIGGD